MSRDKILRLERLRFVARVFQRAVVAVIRQDEIRVRGDGAVSESIVIRIGGNGLKAESWIPPEDRPMRRRNEGEECLELLPVRRAVHLQTHLLIFQPDCRRHRDFDLAITDGMHQPLQTALLPEHADHHIRVEHHGHGASA